MTEHSDITVRWVEGTACAALCPLPMFTDEERIGLDIAEFYTRLLL
jgi:hypothetical protein